MENKEIKIVESYIYLGQSINLQQPNQELEINRRVQLGWAALDKLRYIMKSNLPLCLKKKVFNQCILPIMTYGAEAWTLSKSMENKLAIIQRVMERAMIGISRIDKREKQRNKTTYKGEGHYHQSQRTKMAMDGTRDSKNKQPLNTETHGLDTERWST